MPDPARVNFEQSSSAVPPLAIGSDTWPGLAKLAEECGELLQVIGKLIAYPDSPHPDGSDLVVRLGEEIGDVLGAAAFVLEANDMPEGITSRSRTKLMRFRAWHEAERS